MTRNVLKSYNFTEVNINKMTIYKNVRLPLFFEGFFCFLVARSHVLKYSHFIILTSETHFNDVILFFILTPTHVEPLLFDNQTTSRIV